MKKVIIFILLLLSVGMLFSCKQKKAEQKISYSFSEENFPKLDGSTAAIPLGEAAASVLLGKERADCAAYSSEFSGTHNCYMNLVNKSVDLLLAYEPSAETRAAFEDSGVEIEMAPIGRDALVFLVNKENLVDNLTAGQICDIYQGKIANWKDVKGNDFSIMPFQRGERSGSQTLMRKLVMKDLEMLAPAKAFISETMSGLIEVVADYNNAPHAIGYNVFFYVTEMKKDPNIKILSVNGVEPTKKTISSGKYPFVNNFYAVIRKDEPADSPARVMFEWLQDKAGQELVDAEGYAPVK